MSDEFFATIDSKAEYFIKRLAEAVAIPSVSAEPTLRGECQKMMEWGQDELRKLGAEVTLHDIGTETKSDGKVLPLPNILTATLHAGEGKPTVLLYGHLDVQPAKKSDGWNTEPFVLTEVDGKLYGRGSTDDKGPVLAWLWVIQTYKEKGWPMPVNIKFLLEGMEESGSVGLEAFIGTQAAFLSDVDFVCISDNYYLGPRKPCLTYGLRGMAKFAVEVKCAGKDLHSGVYGGPIAEAMQDLVKILASLHHNDGSMAIEGIYDTVRPFSEEEKALYKDIDFNPEEFRVESGAPKALRFPDKERVLAHRWRFPNLSLHGIEGAFSESGHKTVIPHTVIGKFSIRLVPDMDPAEVNRKVCAHIQKVFDGLGSPNVLKIHTSAGARAWLSDYTDINYTAAKKAIERVHGMTPDFTREGGSIPVTLWLQEATGKSVLLLPIGGSDDGAHSQNEKLNVSNYINGIKVLGAYLEEIGRAGTK